MKLILLTCVQGRLSTVEQCIEWSPDIDRLVIYSDQQDGEFLQDKVKHLFQHPNQPLSEKWNYGLKKLQDIDFTHVVMMGSDDYFNQPFLDYITKTAPLYDMIGFSDMYFMNSASERYYWPGYQNKRRS